MSKPQSLAVRAMRQLSNLEAVEARLTPEAVAAGLERAQPRKAAASGAEGILESAAPAPVVRAESHPEQLAEHGRRAIAKLRRDKAAAAFTPQEEMALEAIVLLEGRPALLIQDGHFQKPPVEWTVLEPHRAGIEAMLGSVGRVEVTGHPSLDWIGTGFLVAEGVVMTNRHVAKEFSRQKGAKWSFEPGMKPRIDYAEELGSMEPLEFALSEVIGIHETMDMALLRVAKQAGARKSPKPLLLDKKPKVAAGKKVYVVGYPAWDGHRNEPKPMGDIFRDIYNVKRLQPGEVGRVQAPQKLFDHDCSTLGGNSGSCVVDLETQKVIGLHFSGRYRESNTAVFLSKLAQDKLLKKAGVHFD